MTLYERYKQLPIDFSQLELEPGDTAGGYFCTPVGAEVIGWAGVDGIHFCLVKSLGEMVFAVSPMNPAGKNVRPVADTFEDFLRLVLACGGTAAVEQAWMWNRSEFDSFLETYPPDAGQQTALDGLRDGLGLTPMEDPYGYIKAVQSSFDYGTIPYSEEYYDLAPDEPEVQRPPERPEWKVYFDCGFGQPHTGRDKPGREIPVNHAFSWDGRTWHVPSVYSCGKGLVVDFCVEIDSAAHVAFQEKWKPWVQGERPFTPEEQERWMAETPSAIEFESKASVNGRELKRRGGSGFGWIPMALRPEEEQGEYNQQDWEAVWLMEHYGLDQEQGWAFWRESFPWATLTRPAMKALSLTLEQRPKPVPGPRFTVRGAGDTVPFTHPVTGEAHTLHVVEYEQQEFGPEQLARMEDGEWDYPSCYTAMSYAVTPDLPRNGVSVQDCEEGDRPRRKTSPNPMSPDGAASVGVIASSSRVMVMMAASGSEVQARAACSALRFQHADQIQWRMTFFQKTAEDLTIGLPLPQN